MKRKLYFLTIFMCILGGFNLTDLHAQTTVTIGDGTESSYAIADNYYGYGASQQIYYATEIGSSGTITSIAFKKVSGSDFNRTWSVYLKNIDEETFLGSSYNYAVSTNDLVYNSTFTTTNGWVVLDIDDFQHDGRNLLVTIVDNSNNYIGDQEWSYTIVSDDSKKSLSLCAGQFIDVTQSSQFSRFAGRFNIQLTFEGGGDTPDTPAAPSAPTGLQATVNGTSVTLNWNSVTGATSYNVYINNGTPIETTDPTYTITGLNPATTYCFTVTAVNIGGESSLSDEVCVKTDEIKRYRIKSVDYEGKYLNIAQITSSNTGGKSGVDVAAYAESDMQIFTIEDAGNNNVYFRAASGYYISCLNGWMVCAYRDTPIYATPLRMLDQGDGTFIILCNDGYFKVETVSGGLYPFSNGDINEAAKWTLEEVNSSTPVVAPSAPTNLRATAVTDISVNLSWDASENATSYNVYQGETLIPNVSGTSFQIMGLAPVTEYCFTVTALNEGGEESSHSDKLCVTTLSSAGSDADKVIGDWVGAEPLPIYTTNEYAYSQQIYTSEELGINVACEINEISFYKTNTYSATRNLEIYMLNTDKSSFSTNDWENIYDSYKVFDGEYTFTEQSESEGENECKITLDTSFLYIPGKNILVCVVDKTATKEANLLWFQVYETDGYQSITTYGASKRKLSKLNGFSGINPASYKIGKGYKNRIKLYYQTASAGVLAIPSAIELAFALPNPDNGNYWSEKSIHQKTITIIAKNTNITDISLSDDDDSFFDIPDNIDYNVNPIVFEVKHNGTLTSGSKTANLVITYIGGVETVPLSAVTYTPVEPDVFELPREVDLSTGTYTDTPDFTTLHDDYILPGEGTDGNAPDAVYKFTLTEPKEVDVEVLGDKGIYAIYRAEDLIPYAGPGPSDDNIFVPGASSDVDFFCDFENGFEGLITMNGVGDDDEGRNWEIAVNEGFETELGPSDCAKSLSYDYYKDDLGYAVDIFLSPENYLVTTDKYEITENSVLSFYAKSEWDGWYDGYKVMVSEDGINFETVFTQKAVETTNFKIQEIPLGNYVGWKYIAINHYTDSIAALCIDNLMLSKGGPGSGSGSSSVYPAGTYYVVAAAESEFTVRITVKMDKIPTFTGVGNWNNLDRWNVDYIPNSADIDVIIDGTATITENVVIRSVEIKEERSLTVGADKSLTVVGLIETDNANKLVLEDGAQLFQTNDELLGKFRMKIVAPVASGDYSSTDEMNPTGWQFISSPMKNAATAGFETEGIGYDLFKYDGDVKTDEDLEWINYKGDHADFEAKFQPGRGYMASYTVNGTAEFVGEFNNATNFTFNGLKYHGDDIKAQIDNFHLLGNPFTFDMDWSKTASNDLATGYAVVTTAGGYTYAMTDDIKVGDGFFVKVVGDAPSLTYASNTRGRNKDNNYINLIASGKAGQDNVIINFADNGRDGFDKLENFNKDIAEIYVKENESRYGILNYSEDVEEINIYFNAKMMGYYTINALTNADFANVTLVDRLTGIETDILTNSYTFQAMTDDKRDRFVLRISKEVVDDSFVYRSGNELIVNAEGKVQILDVMGRVVYNSDIVDDNHRINISTLNSAAYIIRVVNTNEVKTQKVVIW